MIRTLRHRRGDVELKLKADYRGTYYKEEKARSSEHIVCGKSVSTHSYIPRKGFGKIVERLFT